jgi:hypothetical protein
MRSTTMDVGGWLLGLGNWEVAFRDNVMGEDVLAHLTAEDLRKILAETVGDGCKLLAVIAGFAPLRLTEPRSPPSPPVRVWSGASLKASPRRGRLSHFADWLRFLRQIPV